MNKNLSVGDWHFGSAIIFMMIIILISMAIMNKYSNGKDKEGVDYYYKEDFFKHIFILLFVFLYLPIVTLAIFINDSKSMSVWNGLH
ncbi:MAG: hypothetical protein ACLRPW_13025 [Intestinibacter sp.]